MASWMECCWEKLRSSIRRAGSTESMPLRCPKELLLAAIAASLALSQTIAQSTGAISGTVSDRSQTAIGNVAIQAKNSATGATTSAHSDSKGNYALAGLPAGAYQLFAAGPGLAPFVQPSLNVEAGQTMHLDIRLDDVQLNTLGEDRDYYAALAGAHDAPRGPTPRMPDGKPDLSGVWLPSFPTDFGNPEPLPWAAALTKDRQENHSKDIPSSHCLPI